MKNFLRIAALIACVIAPSSAWAVCGVAAGGCFWVGGTGTWDNSTTTNWASSSGGIGGVAVPASTSPVTFDGSSGGGTVTVAATINGSNTIAGLTLGAFTGTLDFATNNPNITTIFVSLTGTGTRTLNMGSGTWTLNNAAAQDMWDATTTTNLTFNKNTSTILANFTHATNFRTGGLSYNTITVGASPSEGASLLFSVGNPTFANFNITAPSYVKFNFATTTTITNAFAWTGSSGSIINIGSGLAGTPATITTGSGTTNTATWAAFNSITFTPVGGSTLAATNSFDLRGNSGTGFTITAPATGGGTHILGSGI